MRSFAILIVMFWMFMAIGYVQGVVKFVKCDFEPDYKAEIVYGVGIVTGLNGFIGWFDVGELKEKE